MDSNSTKTIKILRVGISDAITEVIMIGVALVVVFSAMAWIIGLWGQEASTTAEKLNILPDSVVVIDSDAGSVWLELHIRSDIKPSIEVYKVSVYSSTGIPSSVISTVEGGPVTITPDGKIVMPVGTEAWIRVDFPALNPSDVNPVYGDRVEVVVYTSTGYMYKGFAVLRIQ